MTSTLILVPGSAVPSRELLAVWGLFPYAKNMTNTSVPRVGWICSKDPIEYAPDQWDWREEVQGYWTGSRRQETPCSDA